LGENPGIWTPKPFAQLIRSLRTDKIMEKEPTKTSGYDKWIKEMIGGVAITCFTYEADFKGLAFKFYF